MICFYSGFLGNPIILHQEFNMSVFNSIPVIDISRLEDDPSVGATLEEACRNWGSFQVVGHGVPTEMLDAVLKVMRAFFALPADVKQTVERTMSNPWGFFGNE